MREGAIQRVAALLELGSGIRSRGWYTYRCPFSKWKHQTGQDRRPGFGIKINDRGQSHYFCLACKASGPVNYLPVALARYSGNEDAAQARMFEIMAIETDEGFGLFEDGAPIEEILEPLDERTYGNLYPSAIEYKEAKNYCLRRGISVETIAADQIGYDPEDKRIVWPVRGRNGELYGYTGRTILKEKDWPAIKYGAPYAKSKDYLSLPKRLLLLGAEKSRSKVVKAIVAVEGPIDKSVAAGHLSGTPYLPVGLLGSVFTQAKIDLLVDIGLPVYFFLDNDAAGDLGIYGDGQRKGGLAKLITDLPCYVPSYPDREPYNANNPKDPVEGELDIAKLSRAEILTAIKEAKVETP